MPEVENESEMDPLAAAAALTNTANKAAKNSVIQALFLPTAKAYGDHWGAETREKLKKAKLAKAQSNVTEHLLAVQPFVNPDFKPDPELTDAWMRGAESVDPVDEDLSAAWRATLLEIGAGNPFRRRMLEVVKMLNPDEARAFMALAHRSRPSLIPKEIFFSSNRSDDQSLAEYRARLETLGLLRSRWEFTAGPQILSGLMFGVLLVVTLVFIRFYGLNLFSYNLNVPQDVFLQLVDGVTPLLLGVFVLYFGLMFARGMTRISLTSFGEALASAVRRLEAPAPSQESEAVTDAEAPAEDTNTTTPKAKPRRPRGTSGDGARRRSRAQKAAPTAG